MADQRISELFEISSSGVASNDTLPIVDTNVSQTKKVTAKGLAEAGFRLADNSTLSGAKIIANSITGDKLASNTVGAINLATGSVTSEKIGNEVVGTAQLGANSVTSAKIGNNAVTFAKIQTVSTNTILGRSTAGNGNVESISCTAAGRSILSAASASAQRTVLGLGNISLATGTWANGATVSGTNTGDQTITLSGDVTGTGTAGIAVTIGTGAVGTTKIADSSITTAKIAGSSVTDAKLADHSVTIIATSAPVANGTYLGQQYFDSTTNIEYTWTGEDWRQQAGIGTINVSPDVLFTYDVDSTVSNTATISGQLNTQIASRFFAGPASGSDAAPTFRAIHTSDLPLATNSALGVARPGSGLTISANGIIDHSNNVASGNYYKVTVDGNGHVVAGNTVLVASDIPLLDASKITTGTFGSNLIADDAINGTKIADRIVCNFGETRPATGEFVGQFFYDPINKDTYVWDSNVWQPISVTAGAIVLAGLYDAGANEIVSLTGPGAAVSGFTISGAIPTATSGNSGYYFLINASGVGSGNAPNVTLVPPDLIISDGSAWYEVDVSSSYVNQNASSISFVPTADVAATNIQSAIEEVSTECRNASNIASGTLAVSYGGTSFGSYTKGDLLAGSGTTLVKLPIGSNGQALIVDSTAGAGMRWGTVTAGTVTSVSGVSPLSVSSATTTPVISVGAASTSAAGVVQLTNSTSTTSSTIAATATAVKSAWDLANAALPKSGGTMTGNLQLNSSSSVVFQGTSFNTTLSIVNPSAARSISLPNASGTIITTGDSGTVTSAMIADGTIVNADISATAAISGTKIQAATTSVSGVVVLSSSISSTSTTTAATPSAVKTAYDLANAAMPKAGGVFTGTVSGITAAPGTDTTALATTAFVQNALTTGQALIGGSVTVASGSKTLAVNEFCTAVTSGITFTLPASPASGTTVGISIAGDFTNTIVDRNFQNIMGIAEDLTIDNGNISVLLKYVDATRGWRII